MEIYVYHLSQIKFVLPVCGWVEKLINSKLFYDFFPSISEYNENRGPRN